MTFRIRENDKSLPKCACRIVLRTVCNLHIAQYVESRSQFTTMDHFVCCRFPFQAIEMLVQRKKKRSSRNKFTFQSVCRSEFLSHSFRVFVFVIFFSFSMYVGRFGGSVLARPSHSHTFTFYGTAFLWMHIRPAELEFHVVYVEMMGFCHMLCMCVLVSDVNVFIDGGDEPSVVSVSKCWIFFSFVAFNSVVALKQTIVVTRAILIPIGLSMRIYFWLAGISVVERELAHPTYLIEHAKYSPIFDKWNDMQRERESHSFRHQ